MLEVQLIFINALQIFKKKGVHFISLSEKIDTNTAIGVAIFSILASIAQLERDLISDRVRIGLANARAKGKLIGRKRMRDSDLIRKLLKSGRGTFQILPGFFCDTFKPYRPFEGYLKNLLLSTHLALINAFSIF